MFKNINNFNICFKYLTQPDNDISLLYFMIFYISYLFFHQLFLIIFILIMKFKNHLLSLFQLIFILFHKNMKCKKLNVFYFNNVANFIAKFIAKIYFR
jgi:hypothetical protein